MKTTPTLLLPYPEAADTSDVPRDIKALAEAIDPLGHVPVGAFMFWPAVNAPAGVNAAGKALWLLMIGQVVSATDYPGLATVLGSAGGNVTVPDMRNVFPVGAGAGNALGSRGGADSVVLTAAQAPLVAHNHGGNTGARDRTQSHTHTVPGLWMAVDVVGAAVNTGDRAGYPGPIGILANDAPDHLHSIASDSRAAQAAHENRPPFVAVNFIIRAG